MRDKSRVAGAQADPAFERLRVFFRHRSLGGEVDGAGPDARVACAEPTRRNRAAKASGAVLVPIFERTGAIHVLYTRRALHLLSHSGEVAFPGGKFDLADGNLLVTALRETREEIGLEGRKVEVLGRLPFSGISRSGVAVTPFVGIVHSLDTLRPNPDEVAEVFSVPLRALRDESRCVPYRYPRTDGSKAAYPGIKYRGRVIWGLTLRITMTLLECFDRADKLSAGA